ncbi:MAG: phage/plasmid primase, P4 family [Aquamicrobium sp.]|uniref:DNA primase family protein n=1 Tax=Aquamicrobium sp. TaxID=1872579 RepID=UPI00349E4BD5|nr:phage/plasmid primase, P4 family [Aquamicrobium sp.]
MTTTNATVETVTNIQSVRGRIINLPPPTAPLDVAMCFARRECLTSNGLTLHYWRGGWWAWSGTHWAEIMPDVVEDRLYAFTAQAVYEKSGKKDPMPWSPNRRRIGDVVAALRGVVRLDDEINAPCWLDGPETAPLISCSNGLLDIGTRELRPHTPLYFNLHSVSFAYEPEARCPEFDRFVASLWDEDDETPRTLKQMLGYFVSGRTDMHCVFGLIGLRRAGKGTIARVATGLLGGNVAALTQADLGYTFGLEHVIGKPLAIISDARTSGKNTQTVVERLLSISGEDAVPVPRKNRPTWHGRLPTRIMILSNEMPYLGDASTAVAYRFVMLVFSRTFAGKEDRELEKKLDAELPGILNVALDGLDDLDRTGHFTQSKAAREMVEDIADLSSPVRVFMREECDLAPNFRVGKEKLYRRYRCWAERNGHSPLATAAFARALYAAGEGKVGKARGRTEAGREQSFTGLRLNADAYESTLARADSQSLKTLQGGRTTDHKQRIGQGSVASERKS